MPCPICAANHDYHVCSSYVTASQNLKDFLKACWDAQLSRRAQPDWAKDPENLYEFVYGPGQIQQNEAWWEFKGAGFGIRERIYLSVTDKGYDELWTKFAVIQHEQSKVDVPFIKRCNKSLRLLRPDNIILYVRNEDVRKRLIETLRAMCREQPALPNGRPAIPARIPRDRLRDAQVPATTRVSDLRGVGYATDPGPGLSHGQQLCKHVAKAFKVPQRDYVTFLGAALGVMKRSGVNLAQPSAALVAKSQ
jgi:hypothetical protein